MKKAGAKQMEMYALADDPLERRNLADAKQKRDFQALAKLLREWENTMAAYAKKKPPVVPKVDERLMQQLRSIGYAH